VIAVGAQPPLEELDELELLDDEELLLEDELDELLDELEELLVVVELPTQLGGIKLPSWLPWKPNTLLAV
jgi:hypothetical protein